MTKPQARGLAASRTFERMTTAPVAGLVLRLGVPTMLSMLVTALYNTASTYYVSYLGTSAVGAMGVVFALQMIIQAIGIMIGQGCATQTQPSLPSCARVLFLLCLLGLLWMRFYPSWEQRPQSFLMHGNTPKQCF